MAAHPPPSPPPGISPPTPAEAPTQAAEALTHEGEPPAQAAEAPTQAAEPSAQAADAPAQGEAPAAHTPAASPAAGDPAAPPAAGETAGETTPLREDALHDLTRQSIGPAKLGLLLLLVAGLELGWVLVGTALVALDDIVDAFTVVFAAFLTFLGALALVPSAVFLVRGVRDDRAVRAELKDLAAQHRDPIGDARFSRAAITVCWLLVSLALVTAGVLICASASTSGGGGGYLSSYSTTNSRFAYTFGAGAALVVPGLLGVAKAIAHHAWAARLLDPVPAARARGGAHR
ncbi:hypothetical protein [Streptomyces sp. NPDC047315]|uniref:hypothetical protein n=1 Tax=Streptomyces sp. NPDC047315 TaxID=3155142 RepID=UPI00340F2951